MADQDTHTSRAEQRMLAVAKLKRAASLPRMKDGRRPPMHVEAVSEGEKAQSGEAAGPTAESNTNSAPKETVQAQEQLEEKEKSPEPDSDHAPQRVDKAADGELEADTELEGRPLSPTTAFKKRRSRSRSRSRGSKDFKAKFHPPQSPLPQIAGDSSPDENAPFTPPSTLLPMNPPLVSPIPHFPFLQQSPFLRSPATASPEMSPFYPGTSPPTPLPTLEDLQRGLMRSNSAGSAAAVGRRMAMHKLTGGTETYDASPSPTPPPFLSKLSRNNTVSGGERSAARMNLLNRLGTRITKEADAETASGAEDRGAPSPTPKKRRRRSRRASGSVSASNINPPVSDSDFTSTNTNTPALPSTPLPALLNHFAEIRAQSTTPNQLSSSRTQSSENATPPLPTQTQGAGEDHERPEHTRRRSVLVEDPDEEDRDLPEQKPVIQPGTPRRVFQAIDESRLLQSEMPSNGSSLASTPSAIGVPLYLSERASSRNQMFPTSPFSTPLKEKPLSDEDEEQVIYPATTARPRTPYANTLDTYEREISWVASPVPEIRMPVDDEEEEEEEEMEDVEQEIEVQVDREEAETPSSHGFSPEAYDDTSPRASSSSKSILVESENLPDTAYRPTSPSQAAPLVSQPASINEPGSPQFYPTRLSVASKIQSIGDRSPLNQDLSDWDDRYLSTDSPKRPEPSSTTTWDKIKGTFSRAGSSTGRRSRTNSIVNRERRDNTDSSISRESGASLMSSKTDKGESAQAPTSQPQAPPLMQTPSASASILSLSPLAPPRSGASPLPPPSADMAKYQNAKLFPFPGMLRLEEERRLKGLPSATASTPDVSVQQDESQGRSSPYAYPNAPTQFQDAARERKLSHQNSDTRLYTKFATESNLGNNSAYHSSDSAEASSSIQNGSSYGLKLPTTIPQVKQWLSYNSKRKVASPASPSPGTVSFSPLQPVDPPAPLITNKKPSLSDIFGGKKANDLSDWEDISGLQSNADSGVQRTTVMPSVANRDGGSLEPNGNGPSPPSKSHNLVPLDLAAGRVSPYKFPHELASSARLATPDPSSVSDYPAPTASESSSTSSSQYSLRVQQGAHILERLEENLARGSRSPIYSSALEDPPRKLLLSSPVLQVVNPSTVKDRFLFLFNDILVIAKPVTYDQDNLMDNFKVSAPDRKYTIKSVVQLRNLRFCPDRIDTQAKVVPLSQRNPLIRTFIFQFSRDADHAITTLFSKSNLQENATLLGQLLARTLELDKSRLGEYLSRKTSKTVLKAYLDSFGFAGLRVDVALRVFLQSINVSQHSNPYAALEHLLDSFGSRWYEANAKFVAYDKDLAVRLVWAIAQLNERLHGGIADEPGPTDHIRRTVTSKEFLDAFRRYDARYLVSDDLLQELYRSIYHERLCQALSNDYGSSQDTPITIKRPLPTRLTYKTQSEPIVFRLPQADPSFTIELFGQDMEFDPPVLHFSRSSEASFRVMGKSLGSKTITMCRSGPNAIKYTGLPVSHTIVVERAFMRNTFQLAFLQAGAKRRYMFSVDDPIIRNEWATSLKRQIDSATAAGSMSSQVGKLHKAADDVAFKVLQETLMGGVGAINTHSLTASLSTQNSGIGSHLTGSSVPFTTSPLHNRSKSRSRVYHRHGAGRNELDITQPSPHTSFDSNEYSPESSDQANSPEQRPDGIQWTMRDLEIHCQQNSTISLVLSFLQVRAPETSINTQSF
ncbi:hypothetical protein CPC08DRAFT_681970 [Agrocybe pediades]|nr:hypothetical protein CPC08DRAFT_681970 [Agrocybe pediades]